jgi:hypothetical protein
MPSKDEFLNMIHDKIDHVKATFPRFQLTNKMICGLG